MSFKYLAVIACFLSSSMTAFCITQKEFEKLEQEAEQGDAQAQLELGRCFAKGDGVERNLDIAALWFKKAADQDVALAQCNLGQLYIMGAGVERDPKQAYE